MAFSQRRILSPATIYYILVSYSTKEEKARPRQTRDAFLICVPSSLLSLLGPLYHILYYTYIHTHHSKCLKEKKKERKRSKTPLSRSSSPLSQLYTQTRAVYKPSSSSHIYSLKREREQTAPTTLTYTYKRSMKRIEQEDDI